MKTNQIVISGQSVSKIEYKNQPVVTFRMIDDLHQRPEGTANRNFVEHREKFIQNVDFFVVPHKEAAKILILRNASGHGGLRRDMYFFTLQGYLMLTKAFQDDLAWRVHRELVNGYFLNLEKYQQFLLWRENPYTYLSDMSKASGHLPDLAVQMCAYHIEFDSKNYYILSDYSDREIVIPIKVFPQKTKLVKLFFEKTRTVLKLPTKFSKFADMLNTFHAMAEERLG